MNLRVVYFFQTEVSFSSYNCEFSDSINDYGEKESDKDRHREIEGCVL